MKYIVKTLKYLFFIFAVLFIANILKNDFNSKELKSLIYTSDYKFIFLAILVSFILLIVKGFRLKSLANAFNMPINIFEATKIQAISIVFSLMTPGRAGEFTKIFMLAKDKKELIPEGTVICIFERLTDVLVLVLMSILLCFFTFNDPKIVALLILALIGLLFSFGIVFRMDIVIDKLGKFIPQKIKSFLENFVTHKDKLKDKAFIIFLYSFLVWSIDGLFQWFLLESISSHNNIVLVIGINAIVAIMGILTILPLGLGTMDFSALFLYSKILSISNEKIVFLLGASRFFGLSVLLAIFIPSILLSRGLKFTLKGKIEEDKLQDLKALEEK